MYVKDYDGKTKGIYFLIKHDDLWKKNNTIWAKITANVKKNLIVNLCVINNLQNKILLL